VGAVIEHLVSSNVSPLVGVEFLGPSNSTLKEAAALLGSYLLGSSSAFPRT